MTVETFIKDQSEQFAKQLSERAKKSEPCLPVITIAMEPGSGGLMIADRVAKRLGFHLYNKDLLVSMAHKAEVKESILEEIEKGRPSKFEDFVRSLLPKGHYVYKGDYFEMLKDTITTIGTIGHSVVVGRGANFIIPVKKRFSVRVIAPKDIRIKNVAFFFKVTPAEAEKRIANREARRKAFIKENFRKNIGDPMHYDLIINTERLDLETCTEMIIGAIKGAQAHRVFEKSSAYILRANQ